MEYMYSLFKLHQVLKTMSKENKVQSCVTLMIKNTTYIFALKGIHIVHLYHNLQKFNLKYTFKDSNRLREGYIIAVLCIKSPG